MKNIIIFIAIGLLISCSNKKVPEYVIPHNDMVEIIVDMHLADALFSVTNIRRDLVKQEITRNDTVDYYDEIFYHYGYTRKDFDTSVYYYSEHINEYDDIYQEVLNRLNEMDTQLRQEKEANRKEEEEIEE